MVHRATHKRPSIIIYIIVAIVVASLTFAAFYILNSSRPTPQPETPLEPTAQTTTEPATPDFINLQPIVDNWLATLNKRAEVAVYIYDLDNGRVAAESNANTKFFFSFNL